MAITAYKTFSDGDVLPASDLNSSFARIIDNALSLISPLTGNLDMDGNALLVDSDADSKFLATSDDVLAFRFSSTDLFKWDMSVASAVNGITWTSAATGNPPIVQSQGSDTNIGLVLRGKGTGTTRIQNAAGTKSLFIFDAGVASAVNGVTATSTITAGDPTLAATGDDTNINLTLKGKGTGVVKVSSASGTDLHYIQGGVASAVNGLDIQASATGSPVILAPRGSDTNIDLNLVPKGSGTIKHNSVIIPFVKTFAQNSNNDQAITANTETDVTGITALSLPDTTSVNTKTYRITGRLQFKDTAAAAGLATLRFYNGANGTKSDTEILRASVTYPASALGMTIPLGPYEWTPSNSAHTKFGFSITLTQNGTVYGNNTASQNIAHVLVERVA